MSTNPAQVESQIEPARIGRWVIPAIPAGWVWLPGFGIQKRVQGAFPSNIHLREDPLPEPVPLPAYVAKQITMMANTFLNPEVAGPAPASFPAADEAALLMLRHHSIRDLNVFQVQYYIRLDKWIGIITLTTSEAELLVVRPDLDQFMKVISVAGDEGVA